MAKGKTTQDKSSQQFYRLVGQCIAEWARIDDHIFIIFHQCLGAPRKQCAIVYYRTPGLDLRLGLSDEIIRSVLPATKSGAQPHRLIKEWGEIKKEIGDLLGTRRRIAHHPVTPQTFVKGALGTFALGTLPMAGSEVIESFMIYANENERLRAKEATQAPLTINDLIDHYEAVNNLWPRLYRFYLDFGGELSAEPTQPNPPLSPVK